MRDQRSPLRIRRVIWAVAMCGLASLGYAGTITIGGTITQSTSDGTGPAVNNPGLNLIADGDPFTVTLSFAGPVPAPSASPYNLTGSMLVFTDGTVTESSFGSISLSIVANGANDDLSLLACLTTGSSCGVGNELTANFAIPAASLTAQSVAATGLDQPHPMDLLEDDSVTDIQGSIAKYSDVPEAGTIALAVCGALTLFAAKTLKEKL
jgi:hypothetical protein